jgi:hypothetical protein
MNRLREKLRWCPALVAALGVGIKLLGRDRVEMTYAQELRQSDIVVIAEPVSNEDAKSREDDENPFGATEGVNTRFKVVLVFKGAKVPSQVQVFHYRWRGQPTVNDAPPLPWFSVDINPTTDNGQFLLFLKAGPNGSFVPVSGQVDPGDSCRRLQPMSDQKADDDPPARNATTAPSAINVGGKVKTAVDKSGVDH